MWKWKKEKNESVPKRTYRKELSPVRKLFIWGFDEKNNPSFIVLYGKQAFKQGYELQETVTYTESMLFKGSEGHFPSFESVRILDQYDYFPRQRKRGMYYTKDIQGNGYWCHADEKDAVKEFRIFKAEEQITLPYFEPLSHEKIVQALRDKKLMWNQFTPANHPGEVLGLYEGLIDYTDKFIQLFTNQNIYSRKKILSELLESNPAKELYEYILSKGSSELISGLFMELGKKRDTVLFKEAEKIANEDNLWAGAHYGAGINRCARLYLLAVQPDNTEQAVKLRQTLPDMDLHIINKGGKALPPGKVLEGRDYRKMGLGGELAEFQYYCEYSEEHGKYRSTKKRCPQRYKKSIYSDGVILDINQLKNALQMAELMELPDVVGKIAYYLDAPRLHYYFRGVGKIKAHHYFIRYARRILDRYASVDEQKFVEAMKVLFTSYTNADYLCKYKGNFQFNYFIKHFLYHDFHEKAPEDWYDRFEWMREDQLARLEGRFEFGQDIWDRHLEDVIDILSKSKISVISKAFYYILQSPENRRALHTLSYEQLVSLVFSPYEPAANMFLEILTDKMKRQQQFDMDIMLALMQSQSEKIQSMALQFFKKTNGRFSGSQLAAFLISENITYWEELFINGFVNINEQEYMEFIKSLIYQCEQTTLAQKTLSDELQDTLLQSVSKLQSEEYRKEAVSLVISALKKAVVLPGYLQGLAEQLLFSNSYENLRPMLADQDVTICQQSDIPRSRILLVFLQAVKSEIMPADALMTEILETGSAGMVKMFLNMAEKLESQLHSRFSTLLLMMESDVASLHEIVKSVYFCLPIEEQKKFIAVMIDSPDEKTFLFGLEKLQEMYFDSATAIPNEQLLPMLEHPSAKVRAFVSEKIDDVISNIGMGDGELFLYYAKTLLYLPNKFSLAKNNIYDVLLRFVKRHNDFVKEVELLLTDLGGSNCKLDCERALVTLAKIKREVVLIEG